MFLPRIFASGIAAPAATVLVLVASCICTSVQAAAPSEGEWKSAGTSRTDQGNLPTAKAAETSSRWTDRRPPTAGATLALRSNSAKQSRPDVPRTTGETDRAVPGAQPHWQLPNATAHTNSPVTEQPNVAKLTASKRTVSTGARREPREFLAPADALPLSTTNTPSRYAPPSYQTPLQQTAVAQAANSMTRGRSLAASKRPNDAALTGRSRTTGTSARRIHARRKSTPSLWDTINVAFEGPEQMMSEPENLPLPVRTNMSTSSDEMHVELMPDVEGHGEFDGGQHMSGEHTFDPYCGDDCCGDGVCEPDCACSCGGGIECGCEPGCGCGSGDCQSQDLFCVGCDDDESCHSVRVRLPKWQEFVAFGGVHGFKGPYDRERDSGNFGFHEGFNIGFKVPFSRAGYQIGYQAVHSQLNGDADTNIADPHTQHFFTAGMFQRAKDGVQFGIVWDMLRDERFGAVDFHQLRGELSMIERGCHEIGIAAAVHLSDHEPFPADDETPSVLFQPSDQYLLFYRMHGPRGGEGRIYGGFNDDDDGIVGADMLVPLSDRWSLQTGFTYLIPAEHAGQEGAAQEAWNIATSLVWHWDCRARRSHSSCYRPLFNVADNGYLIIDERLGAPATD